MTVACTADFVLSRFLRAPFKPAGKNCFITGGSTGLGKALAMQLAAAGADVCIVARRESELKQAAEEIEASRRNESQKVVYISADVTSKEDVVRAFDEAKVKMGRNPDFQAAMRMRDSGIQGRIVFVSSMLGMLSFVGWATYAPTKYAVRGLADTLRNELKRYNIDVHIFFPGGIESPGFDTENLTKPKVTKEIEGANTPQTSDECAKSLLKGLYAGNYMIMTDFVSEILRTTVRGVSPTNNLILDWALAIIGQPIASGYALYMDYAVKSLKEDE
ncbi:3-dehydrosphinganine reductase [Apophysomyces sp. BC1015]|nr:3-dehydrosphinganine reductase [Apophysomyces sp. BC1015]